MAITMVISLYSVRLVLESLGTVDYGIFNVIMGVVSMLSFLNAALTVSTQRYLSFYQGKSSKANLVKIFNHSILLHIIMGFLIVLTLEIGGGYILNTYLQIPIERMDVARVVFHFASLAVFFTFISVPYTASINANEKMVFIAMISMLESIEKLLLAFYITITNADRLLIYGICMGCITIFSFIFYYLVCAHKFDECRHFSFKNIDFKLMRELGGFAGWNIIGSLTAISKNQGISILFNIFHGPTVNAAYSIANQVSGQLNFFSATMLRSLNPQIMKSEGSGNHAQMLELINSACKYSFLLLAFFAIPCMFEMRNIMSFWLKEIPEYTVPFCNLILIAIMFDQLTIGINSGFQACKFVKQSAIYVGAIKLMILPIGYIILKLGASVYWVVAAYAFVELIAGYVRIILAKHLLQMNIGSYLHNVIARIIPPLIVSISACLILTNFIQSPSRLFITLPLVSIIFLSATYYFSLHLYERKYIKSIIEKLKLKLHEKITSST